jgi:hypothetical protein
VPPAPVNDRAFGESESTTTPQLFAETSNEPCNCIAFAAWESRTMMHALPPPGIPATARVEMVIVFLPNIPIKNVGAGCVRKTSTYAAELWHADVMLGLKLTIGVTLDIWFKDTALVAAAVAVVCEALNM